MSEFSGSVEFGSSTCPEHQVITARSHLINRIVPHCEIIQLPVKQIGGGRLDYERKIHTSNQPEAGKRRLIHFRKNGGAQQLDDTVFIDFRLRYPQNWAHFLNNHLPVSFVLMERVGLSPQEVTLVLPEKTPNYILRAAEFFGFRAFPCGDTVTGEAVKFSSEPWIGIRAVRADLARLQVVRDILSQQNVRGTPADHLPRKVFLSRRNTRDLENEAEIESLLSKRGYVKVYPEDLSVADQLRLFEHAEEMVAIHGAGLAPLLYISEASKLRFLIELFPCGHMTDVYRVVSHQVGCRWMGVRGKIKPEHIVPAYDLDQPFLKYSLQSFEVDPVSLDLAFEMV